MSGSFFFRAGSTQGEWARSHRGRNEVANLSVFKSGMSQSPRAPNSLQSEARTRPRISLADKCWPNQQLNCALYFVMVASPYTNAVELGHVLTWKYFSWLETEVNVKVRYWELALLTDTHWRPSQTGGMQWLVKPRWPLSTPQQCLFQIDGAKWSLLIRDWFQQCLDKQRGMGPLPLGPLLGPKVHAEPGRARLGRSSTLLVRG